MFRFLSGKLSHHFCTSAFSKPFSKLSRSLPLSNAQQTCIANVEFFKSCGFSQDQISKMMKVDREIFYLHHEKHLLPVIKFFDSKGASEGEIVKICVQSPSVFRKEELVKHFNNITDFLGSEKMTVLALIKFSRIILLDPKTLNANIKAFQDFGVPDENIRRMILKKSRSLIVRTDLLMSSLKEVKELGFDPLTQNFIVATMAIRGGGERAKVRKIETLIKWGWSITDVWNAFKKHPRILMLSDENIDVTMKFFVTKMKRNASEIIQRPKLLDLSMEQRIIPRSEVAKILFGMHLLNGCLVNLFDTSDRKFVQAFVGIPRELVTELLSLKVHLSKLEKSRMRFIAEMEMLSMEHPAREKEITEKKERSLLHWVAFQRKAKGLENYLRAAVTELNKLEMSKLEILATFQELKVEADKLIEDTMAQAETL